MKNRSFIKNSIFGLLPFSLMLGALFGVDFSPAKKVDAYDGQKLDVMPVIDLNDSSDADIKSYYSALNNFDDAERKGTNLLKNLKPILSNNQVYYSYDKNGGENIFKIYEISDRDWNKSPADEITNGTYDAQSNTISNYRFHVTDSQEDDRNPYLHALYVDRTTTAKEEANQMRAWGKHTIDEAYSINREHIWPKSHGFDDASEADGGARGDPMHLWAADAYSNTVHNNNFFGYVDTKRPINCNTSEKYDYEGANLLGYSLTVPSSNIKVFEPQDSDKGDIARALFYMVARYNNYAGSETEVFDSNNPNLCLSNDINNTSGTSDALNAFNLGVLDDLLEWNRLDPPDEYEIHRNNLLYTNFTHNRNPFIDYPEWADIAFVSTSTKIASPNTDSIYGKNIVRNPISISITKAPKKTDYFVGQTFNPEQMVVMVNYDDGTTSKLTDYQISPNGPLTLDDTTITISYGGVSTTQSITVSENHGLLQSFNKVNENLVSGKYLIGCYDKGAIWYPSSSNYSGYVDVEFEDENIVYNNDLMQYLFDVDIQNGTIKFGKNYFSSQTTSSSSDLKHSDIPLTNTLSLSNGDFKVVAENGQILYCRKTDASNPSFRFYNEDAFPSLFNVQLYKYVEQNVFTPVQSVSIDDESLTIEVGDTYQFDWTISPSYADCQTVTWSSNNPSCVSVDTEIGKITALSAGTAVITATSNDETVSKYDSVTVTVPNPIVLESIELTGEYSTDFYVNDEFSIAGLKVIAHYFRGEVEEYSEDVTEFCQFSGYDMNDASKQTVLVSYGGCEESYQINVKEIEAEANTINFVMSQQDFNNAQVINEITIDNFKINFESGGGTSSKYYETGSSVRVYSKNIVTISGPYKITKVTIILDKSDNSTNSISFNSGSFDSSTWIWTGEEFSCSFTVGSDGINPRRISQIKVTYDPNKSSSVKTYTQIDSISQITEGFTYIIGYRKGDTLYAMPNALGSGQYSPISVEINNNQITDDKNELALNFTDITNEVDEIKFYIGNGTNYLSLATTSNFPASGDKAFFRVENTRVLNSVFDISYADTNRGIYYRESTTKFGPFSNSTKPKIDNSGDYKCLSIFKENKTTVDSNSFTAVSNINDLRTDDEIVFLMKHKTSGFNCISTTYNSSSKVIVGLPVTGNDNELMINENIDTFKVVRTNDGFSFLSLSQNKYISPCSATDNYINYVNEINTNSTFALTYGGTPGLFSIVSNTTQFSDHAILKAKLYSGAIRFSCYKSGGTENDVFIYKSTIQTQADAWSKSFIQGTSIPSGGSSCSISNWSTLTNSYNELPLEVKSLLVQTVADQDTNSSWRAQAMARYDYMISNSKFNGITAFISGRGSVASKPNIIINISDLNRNYALIIVVSLIGVTSIGGYFFYSKKKGNV